MSSKWSEDRGNGRQWPMSVVNPSGDKMHGRMGMKKTKEEGGERAEPAGESGGGSRVKGEGDSRGGQWK